MIEAHLHSETIKEQTINKVPKLTLVAPSHQR